MKRGKPAGLSRPIAEISSPSSSDTMPFSGSPIVMNTAQVRPSSTSQKYSNELNFSATSASAGAARTSTIVPKIPPITENTRSAPSTVSAWPFFVITYASSVYAAEAGVPGMRSRQPGMSPEKIAIAVAVTMRGDRRHRRHEERHRHEQRGRHRRGEPRHRADEQPEDRRRAG